MMEKGKYIIRANSECQEVAIDQPGSDLDARPILYPHLHYGPNQTWMIDRCTGHSDSSGFWILSDLDNEFGLARDAELK